MSNDNDFVPVKGHLAMKLRAEKGFGRPEMVTMLADAGDRMDPQTLYRIEKKETARVSRRRARALAQVLGVSFEIITGKTPMEQDGTQSIYAPRMNYRLLRAEHNSFELIAFRYGVSARAIAAVAPLAFAILAEQSLEARKKNLAAYEERLHELGGLQDALSHLGAVTLPRNGVDQAIEAERRSIAARELNARSVLPFAYDVLPDWKPDDPHDEAHTANPFLQFLRESASRLGLESHRVDWPDDSVRVDFPRETVDEFSGEDPDIAFVLTAGFLMLRDMPANLKLRENAAERLAWLRDRIASDAHIQRELAEWGRISSELGWDASPLSSKENNSDQVKD